MIFYLILWIIIQLVGLFAFIDCIAEYGYKALFKGMPIFIYLILLPAILLACMLAYVPYKED